MFLQILTIIGFLFSITGLSLSLFALHLNSKLRDWYQNKVKELESNDYAVVILKSQISDFESWRDCFPDKSDLEILKMLINVWEETDKEEKENAPSDRDVDLERILRGNFSDEDLVPRFREGNDSIAEALKIERARDAEVIRGVEDVIDSKGHVGEFLFSEEGQS